MYYVCLENNAITSILSYEPNVPDSVDVCTIQNLEYESITANTHYFDIETKTVLPISQEIIDVGTSKESQRISNAEKHKFLLDSDWKVLRHIREKALGQPTSLTDEQYLELEQQRADAAAAIVEIQ
jgi:hypothetical protein